MGEQNTLHKIGQCNMRLLKYVYLFIHILNTNNVNYIYTYKYMTNQLCMNTEI